MGKRQKSFMPLALPGDPHYDEPAPQGNAAKHPKTSRRKP
jgi:hypothetical protein